MRSLHECRDNRPVDFCYIISSGWARGTANCLPKPSAFGWGSENSKCDRRPSGTSAVSSGRCSSAQLWALLGEPDGVTPAPHG